MTRADNDLTGHRRTPCSECPWRRDVATGRFPTHRFEALAETAYDMALKVFTCHKSSVDAPRVCAGFLLRGADHNFSVRMATLRGEIAWGEVGDGGSELYDSYREMAEANGVGPDCPVLDPCR